VFVPVDGKDIYLKTMRDTELDQLHGASSYNRYCEKLILQAEAEGRKLHTRFRFNRVNDTYARIRAEAVEEARLRDYMNCVDSVEVH